MPTIFGKLLNFKPEVSELKVVKNYHELDEVDKELSEEEEARQLLDKINQGISFINDNPTSKMIFDGFNTGIPMVPFPEVEGCLGLMPKDSSMKIQDGYAVLAYDFDVRTTNTDCIFNMEERRAERKLRIARQEL